MPPMPPLPPYVKPAHDSFQSYPKVYPLGRSGIRDRLGIMRGLLNLNK